MSLPRILCVDDEERVLAGLALSLRKAYEVLTATGAEAAFQLLRAHRDIAVVVSDMRMPGMDGAAFLQRVREQFPTATRILLTGDAGRDAAIRAVNEGQIFRFLTKPCPPQALCSAVEAGLMQHRLILAERAVLQETLLGCIQALTDVLAITNFIAFGRASRLRRLAMQLADRLGCGDFWQLAAAAMLSQVGYISLPIDLVDKVYRGERLTEAEETLVSGVPEVATRLLQSIPRLEPVVQVLQALSWSDELMARKADTMIGTAARILGLVIAYDDLIAQDSSATESVQALRSRSARFGVPLIDALAEQVGAESGVPQLVTMALRHVQVGMTLMQDVRTSMGTLLVAKGYEVTESFRQRMPNFGPDLLGEQVRVLARS